MKKNILILLLFIFAIFGCKNEKKETINEVIIAQVNDSKLTLNELKGNFTEEEWKNITIEKKRKFVNEWINLTVLSQESDLLKFSDSPVIKSRIKSAIMKIKTNALISQKISEVKTSEKELFEYYRLHKSKYQKEENEFKIQRIYLKKKEVLENVLNALKDGMKFVDAAKEYSKEKIGKSGGWIGFQTRKQLGNKAFNKLLKVKKWQQIVVEDNNGYYIIRYYETRKRKVEKNFDEVKDIINTILIQKKKEQIYDSLLKEVKSKSTISISI